MVQRRVVLKRYDVASIVFASVALVTVVSYLAQFTVSPLSEYLTQDGHAMFGISLDNSAVMGDFSPLPSRRLLSLANCTPPAVEQFPKDLFSDYARIHGGFLIHALVAAYMFLAIALVCDDYFVPSCEKLCDVFGLQEDVAGATFMAAGSSAPELATTVIGVFIAQNDIGLSAVVGSAIFNIMFVISVCALFAGSVIYLSWWPLFRDCIFYALSILALVLVIVDEFVHWYEALSLLLLYVSYLVLMYFNPRIEAWIVPKFPSLAAHGEKPNGMVSRSTADGFRSLREEEEGVFVNSMHKTSYELDIGANKADRAEAELLLATDVPSNFEVTLERVSNGDVGHSRVAGNGKVAEGSSSCTTTAVENLEEQGKTVSDIDDDNCEDDDESAEFNIRGESKVNDADEESVWSRPAGCVRGSIWFISLPLIAITFVTVPDCRRSRWRGWYPVTFLTSMCWIGVYAYLMVWMLTLVGHTWRVPDSVMSLTLIAAGSSVPDAIASLIVVRNGQGDMAVSNAVGSNVFDILLCLGLPWFLHTTIVDRVGPVEVYSAGLTYSTLTLFTTVLLLLVLTHFNRWRLTRPYGVVLMIIYILFNVLTCLYELNYFGFVHPPECFTLTTNMP